MSRAWDSLNPDKAADDAPGRSDPWGDTDCVAWYNFQVAKVGRSAASEGLFGNFARVVGITDDKIGDVRITGITAILTLIVCLAGYFWFLKKERAPPLTVGGLDDGEAARDGLSDRRRKEIRMKRSRLLQHAGNSSSPSADTGVAAVVEKPGTVKFNHQGGNDRGGKREDNGDNGNDDDNTGGENDRKIEVKGIDGDATVIIGAASALGENGDDEVPTKVLQLSFSLLFPTLQASRKLLNTLKSNAITSSYSHLLPTVLGNLVENSRVEKFYSININSKNNFYKYVYKYKPFRGLLHNLGFADGGKGMISLPFPMPATLRRLVQISIWELKGMPFGGGRELPFIEVGAEAETSLDISLRVAEKTSLLYLGGSKATSQLLGEAIADDRFRRINNLTLRVSSGPIQEFQPFSCDNLVKLEFSRCPSVKYLGDLRGLRGLRSFGANQCALVEPPVLTSTVSTVSLQDNSIASAEKIFGEEEEVEEDAIALVEIDLRGNLLGNIPKVVLKAKRLRKARLDANNISIEELVKFAQERKVRLT